MALAVVFQIGSLGDTILSVPSLLSLRELLPDCSEYILISGFQNSRKVHASHIFDMAWPARQKLNYKAQGSPLERYVSALQVVARLRFHRPKYGVYLLPTDRNQKQIDRDKMFFRAAGVRELVGFRAITEGEKRKHEGITCYSTESYLRFRRLWNERARDKYQSYCRQPLLNPDEAAVSAAKDWLLRNRKHPERPLLAICPFSNASARDLDFTTLVELMKRLESELHVETILLGGKKDYSRMEQVRLSAGAGLNASGAFTPPQSAALFRQCVLAVCVDSGPLHLAGAVNLPTVSAYASVNKPFHLFMPLGHNHTMLYHEVGCTGCGAFTCPVEGHPCMSKTTADQLFTAVKAKLSHALIPYGSLNGAHVLEWPKQGEREESKQAG